MTGAKFRFGPELVAEILDWITPTLELGQRQGIIAPGAIAPHVDHAIGFAEAWHRHGQTSEAPEWAVDLGSGAGLPALILAGVWPDSQWFFTETREKRSEFLSRAVSRLGLVDRVIVWAGDVQALAIADEERVDLVTARAFGKPALVAECAAMLLRSGGRIIVSEPGPGQIAGRWPAETLADHDLTVVGIETDRGSFAGLTIGDSVQPVRNRRTMERTPWF